MDKIRHYYCFNKSRVDGGRHVCITTVQTENDTIYQEIWIDQYPNSATLHLTGGLVLSPSSLRELANQLEEAGFTG